MSDSDKTETVVERAFLITDASQTTTRASSRCLHVRTFKSSIQSLYPEPQILFV